MTVNLRKSNRRPGRPPLKPKDRRSVQVAIYVTEAERKVLEAKAGAEGLSLSSWILARILPK